MTSADGAASRDTGARGSGTGKPGASNAQVLEEFWRMQDRWSRLADLKKRGIVRGRLLGLSLIVLAAVLGALSATLSATLQSDNEDWSKATAAAAAACAALVPLLRPLWTGKALVNFTLARRIAENTKSLVVSWLALNGGISSTAETRELNRQVRALRLLAPELIAELDETRPSGDQLPPIEHLDSYLAFRIRDQIDTYYRPRARRIDRTLRVFDRCSFALGLLSALLGAFTVYKDGPIAGSIAGWIAVVTTVATALSTHIVVSGYRFQQLAFTRTAEQLEQLIVAATETPPMELSQVVADGEAIILGENRAWQTALSKRESDDARTAS